MRCAPRLSMWWPHRASGCGQPARQGRRGVAHAGQRQEHHHDLLCRPRDAGAGDGEPDHRRHHRPQRPGRPAVWRVQPGAGPAARAAGAGQHAPGACAQLLANRPSGGIVFATIQKFMPGEDEDMFPVLSDRHNIVVIADEAHRTQYGFEAKLKTRKQNFKPNGLLALAAQAQAASESIVTSDAGSSAVHAEFAPPEYTTQLPGGLRPAPARCAAQRHLRGLHRHAGQQHRPRHARRVWRLHPCLRHAAGQGRRRHGGHLLRKPAGQAAS